MYFGAVLTLEPSPASLNPDSVWEEKMRSGNLKRCLYQPALSCSASSIYFSVCYLQLDTRTWHSVAAAVWEMKQFKCESPKRSYKMMMMTTTMGVWVCTHVEKGGLNCGGLEERGRGSGRRGEPLTTSAACTAIYWERPPTVGKEVGAKKKKKISGWYILQHQLWVWLLSENSQLCMFWVQFGFRWGHRVSWTFSLLNSGK